MTDRKTVCCFTGHRKLPANRIDSIIKRLDAEINNLIHQGVTDFISGGALGFDQIAASLIVARKDMGQAVRLIFALPHHGQDEAWSPEQKRLYRSLLSEADEITYVSDGYTSGCMKKRNQYLVDNADYCICAMLRFHSGTSQTVNMARKKGLKIINVAK